MRFYSTNNKNLQSSFKEAILNGLAPDGGLYMPLAIPRMPDNFFQSLHTMSFKETACEVSNVLFGEDLPRDIIDEIIEDAYDFDAPLIQLDDNLSILELFHGPTLAFKDVAACFMARVMGYYAKDFDQELTILVATSGDTGSAVAHAFLKVPKIRVVILYPSGQVSNIQEKQLTTMGHNIIAFEVKGTFDDCQKLVKQAFIDEEIRKKLLLASANSINIARLFPQTFYYFYAFGQLKNKEKEAVFFVPSGNFGNLTAGLIAKKMGLPVAKFVAAVNANDVFVDFLKNGRFNPQPSKQTISNAMDVGNPSNFARILELYDHDLEKIKKDIFASSFSDTETKQAIKDVFDRYNYILDPHGAVGYLGFKKYQAMLKKPLNGIVIETACPAKFADIVEAVLEREITIPKRLQQYMNKEKTAVMINNDFNNFKNILLEQ